MASPQPPTTAGNGAASVKRLRSFSDDLSQNALSQNAWIERFSRARSHPDPKQYVLFAAPPFVEMAQQLQRAHQDRFKFFPILWDKFPDGTDNITITGFTPRNFVAASDVLFLASFHNNDLTLSQFSVLIVLLQSFISSLTICLPFYPVGTNERVEAEGKVATANTYSMLLSNLPTVGKPTRLMIYDLHTLQNRFYFHSSTIPSLHSTIPLLLTRLKNTATRCVAFPDDGAAKRFGAMFKGLGFDVVVCGKVRNGDKRVVTIQDGNCKDQEVVIVDDLVQTGNTLYECALVLRAHGATAVSAFVAHGVFPDSCWKKFLKGASHGDVFDKFFVTNSIPSRISEIPVGDAFEVLDIMPLLVQDLDSLNGSP